MFVQSHHFLHLNSASFPPFNLVPCLVSPRGPRCFLTSLIWCMREIVFMWSSSISSMKLSPAQAFSPWGKSHCLLCFLSTFSLSAASSSVFPRQDQFMSTHRVLINAFELVAAKTGFLLQIYVTRKFSLITNKFIQIGKKGQACDLFFLW